MLRVRHIGPLQTTRAAPLTTIVLVWGGSWVLTMGCGSGGLFISVCGRCSAVGGSTTATAAAVSSVACWKSSGGDNIGEGATDVLLQVSAADGAHRSRGSKAGIGSGRVE